MVVELYELGASASGGVEPFISKYTAAFLMTVMVALGAVYRFLASSFRASEGKTLEYGQVALGLFGFGGACVLLGVVLLAILEPLISNACPTDVNATAVGTCPITGDNETTDKAAVLTLSAIWLGYPLASIITMLLQIGEPSYTFSESVSLFKDVSYAFLDVASKGGLAFYVSIRSTWL